jgi:two-component system, chemotaxis family, chemotaxis protein CheY
VGRPGASPVARPGAQVRAASDELSLKGPRPLAPGGRDGSQEVWVNTEKVKKILVVEDSKLVHRMYELMLRSHVLVYALDGREGLQRLAENADIDLIVLDINMPQVNGFEFLSHAKANPVFARIPVIIVSTEGKENDIQRGLDAGAAAYLKKPFLRDQLMAVIERVPELNAA